MKTSCQNLDTIAYNQEYEKTEMALEIERKIRKRGLTHKQAAEILGIEEHQLSTILRLKLAGFSSEKLLNFSDILGKGRFTVPNGKDSLNDP
jgi:predicted XRE-type DNA-binding protein